MRGRSVREWRAGVGVSALVGIALGGVGLMKRSDAPSVLLATKLVRPQMVRIVAIKRVAVGSGARRSQTQLRAAPIRKRH